MRIEVQTNDGEVVEAFNTCTVNPDDSNAIIEWKTEVLTAIDAANELEKKISERC